MSENSQEPIAAHTTQAFPVLDSHKRIGVSDVWIILSAILYGHAISNHSDTQTQG